MQLRTRISLLSILIISTVCVCIMVAAFKREELIRLQYSKEAVADQFNIWSKIKDELIGNIENIAWLMVENRELIEALEQDNSGAIRRIGGQIESQLESAEIADRVDILNSNGELIYSSHSGLFQSPIVLVDVAKEAIDLQLSISGVGNDKQRNTAIAFGSPLINDEGKTVGLGVFSLDIVHALAEMERLNDSSVIIVNRRGRLLAATTDNMWERYSNLVDVNDFNELQTIADDDRFLAVTVLPQVADLGGLVGRLVNIKDVTDQVLQQKQISRFTAILIIVFVFISLLSIYFYMSHSFASLTEGVDVLEALSRGNLQIPIELRTGKDEVGQIGSAVKSFRSNLVMLNRYRRSRERQRARQERFIFREMTQLADTLEGEDQRAILKELSNLARTVRNQPKNDMSRFSILDKNAELSNERGGTSDSLTLMAVAFHSMSSRVQDQNQRLRDALATKEALISLRKELDIATRVQLSLLPTDIEKSSAFDIGGGMWPAKEVGGDFYDYFRLDDNRIGVAIADVSGKGVPAALFAVMSRTSLRGSAPQFDSPGKVLESINNFLERHNDENLFITFFYGILDELTGRLTYSNGGHNPPILVDEDGTHTLETTDGVVLGMFGDLDYEDSYIDMTPGSRLVMITDGIPEAFDANNEAYGDDRLLDVLDSLPKQEPSENVKYIVKTVDAFVKDAPQFDDITCVVLQYKGANLNSESGELIMETEKEPIDTDVKLTLKNSLSEIPRVAEEIEQLGESRDWSPKWIFNSNLALDELITNIVNYSYSAEDENKEIQLVLSEKDGNLNIYLEDEGSPFDPFSETDDPSLDDPLEERSIGGLGVFFVKSLVDETYYERRDDRNCVTLVLHTQE